MKTILFIIFCVGYIFCILVSDLTYTYLHTFSKQMIYAIFSTIFFTVFLQFYYLKRVLAHLEPKILVQVSRNLSQTPNSYQRTGQIIIQDFLGV
jgi:hypothetical protein